MQTDAFADFPELLEPTGPSRDCRFKSCHRREFFFLLNPGAFSFFSQKERKGASAELPLDILLISQHNLLRVEIRFHQGIDRDRIVIIQYQLGVGKSEDF